MSRRLGWLLALIMMVLGIGLRLLDPAPIQALRGLVFDAYQKFDPRPYKPSPIRIIDIDDESLSRLGQWPWPRTVLGEMVERLRQAGVATIGFNVVFAESDRTSPARMIESIRNLDLPPAVQDALGGLDLPDNDVLFAASVAGGGVVTGFAASGHRTQATPTLKAGFAHAGDNPLPFLEAVPGAIPTLAPLEAASAGNGGLIARPDPDGVYRRIPLFFRIGGDIYPSLAAEVLRVAQGANTFLIKSSGASGVVSFGDPTGIDSVKIGSFVVPTDPSGKIWLYDTGPVPERSMPAWRVFDPAYDLSSLEGMIVLVGATAAGLGDAVATPVSPVTSAPVLNAQILEQIVHQTFLGRQIWAEGAEVLFLAVLCLLLTLSFMPRRIGAYLSTSLGAIGVIGAVGASWWAFTEHSLLFDPVYPILVGSVVYLINAVFSYMVSETERREVRGAFGRYVAPELVDEIAADPDVLKLGGIRREMTVLFCDVRGFTSFSEKVEPEILTQTLNRFLTVMTDELLSHRGTVDKYMGDAIMAFWNAPFEEPHHARKACLTALDMNAALPALNDALKTELAAGGVAFDGFRIGIGINTGPCLVGNMGSEQRFNYSVIGDSVNLASRLEGQTKEYKVPIIVGESTRDAAGDLAALELDLIRVKGKREAARIFAILGDAETARDDAFGRLVAAHEAMLSAYRGRAWNDARARIKACRLFAGGYGLDPLYDMYDARLSELAASPLPEDWDGVYVARGK